MKKIKRLNVIHTPLNVSVSLTQSGGALTQTHCAETGEYVPDRSLTPLVISPAVRTQDPEGVMADGDAQLVGVAWYALPVDVAAAVPDGSYIGKELSKYRITSATDGYSVDAKSGALTVSRNVPYLSPVVLVFTAGIPDTRSGSIVRVQDSVTLSTSSVAVAASLTLDKPSSWNYDPVSDSGVRTVKASLLLGGMEPDASKVTVKYWWYRVSGDTETLVSEDDLFYESGQDTDTLVIDPSYLDCETLRCKADYSVDGETLGDTPSDGCLTAETTVTRRYPPYEFENYVHGGVEVSPSAAEVKNECVVTVGQRVLESPSEHFSVEWSVKKPVNGAEWIVLGYGDSIMVARNDIEGGADIGLEVSELEPLGAMTDDSGDILTDEEGNTLTL